MSDPRYQIVTHQDIPCLHVMIDGKEAHIPVADILLSLEAYREKQRPKPHNQLSPAEVEKLLDPYKMDMPESWRLPPEMRGKR